MLHINKLSKIAVLLLLSVSGLGQANAQDKKTLNVNMAYYLTNNNIPYLVVNAKTKVDGKFKPVNDIEVNLYLDTLTNSMGKFKTSGKGFVVAPIPPSLKDVWNAKPKHTFLAITKANKEFDETSTELSPTRAKIVLDTADDKNVVATVTEFKDNAWTPVKGLEMKLGIKRFAADLQIGDEQTYTTDSLGQIKGEFKKLLMPGDEKGNLVLAARVDDNDQYGNLRVEKTVPWGVKFVNDNSFFRRALWGTRFRTPIWLLFMAYSIALSVWGILIYLIFMLIKIKKLGKEEMAKK
jgi:hypothetical protein